MTMDIELITCGELETKLYELAHNCYAADKLYIDGDEQFQILEDNKKSYLATLVEAQEGKTTAEKERKALVSPEYGSWLEGYQAARKQSRQLRVERDNLQRLFETCRSILSSKNNERRRT